MTDLKATILVVDDVPMNLQVVGNLLRGENYSIVVASSGRKALEMVVRKRPDLILLDVMMPEMDGFETCRKLKASPITADIPIIFLTARTESDDIVNGFALGAVDYIGKPFNVAELLARVKNQLQLVETLRKLEVANSTKDKFFSIIAHDLRNPLSGIIASLRLLDRKFDDLSEEKKKGFIERLNSSAETAFKLLENLLTWSITQLGKIEYVPSEISLKTVADDTIVLLQAQSDDKKLKVSSSIGHDITAHVDVNMIKTVIRNLVSNAIKFTPQGGSIQIRSEIKEDIVETTVFDSGIGISKEDMEKLFRVDVHHSKLGTNDEKGTGLGLILCKEFIELNHGKIWIESEIGQGSHFKFSLPRKPKEST